MAIHNAEIAAALYEIADLLEAHDVNYFRVSAYRKAAFKIENLADELHELVLKNMI